MGKVINVRNLTLRAYEPKICVPLVGEDMDELCFELDELCSGGCDLVEWRADRLSCWRSFPECERALRLIRERIGETPLLVTMRTFREGGEARVTGREYGEFYKNILGTGMADLIDCELSYGELAEDENSWGNLRELIDSAGQNGVYTVISFHDFKGTPSFEELIRKLDKMRSSGGDILKIAVMPGSERDVAELIRASAEYSFRNPDELLITMSMGRLGSVSRVSGHITGSCVTFAAAKSSSAPGQLAVGDVRNIMGLIG